MKFIKSILLRNWLNCTGEYMLEYFGLDKELYESTFYIKIYCDRGKVIRSKPSIKMFVEIPEKLKDLLR